VSPRSGGKSNRVPLGMAPVTSPQHCLNRPKTLVRQQTCSLAAWFLRARIPAGSLGVQMNSDLQKLIDLQVVDARIASLKAEVAALPQQVAQIEAKLAGSKAQLEAAQAAMK